jgi:KaiC/GvpD/RAD55 family RecA-like ATPase/tetratricopeptide (TPR) repeat protein
MKASALAEPVLIGREKELEELTQYLDSAIEGKGATVLVSGEAGSGKTRLVNEFLNAAKQKTGVTVLTGLCMSNAAVPYLPFVEAFNSYFSQKENDQINSTMTEIGALLSGTKQAEKTRKFDDITPQAWKALTFAAVVKAFSTISSVKPLILFVEDLHWADSASLSLLHFIARRLRSEKVLLIGTFRSEELTTDAEGQAHPLIEELQMMSREDLFKEIKLPSLGQTDVNLIAESMIGGNVSLDLATRLSEESQGNALFVVESLRMLSEHGSLCVENDEWHLASDILGIPNKFKEVIMRRLNLLKFSQRRVLDAASVIGEKFDVELLAIVLGKDNLEVLETLNTVARSTSLVSVEGSFFRFDHAKSRQAIYEEIALPLKRGYHKRVAEKLESTSTNGRLPFSEIAYHYAEAGKEENAVKFAIAAGQDALGRFSNVEAIKHFVYVLQTVPNSPTSAEVKSKALEGLGDAYYANGNYRKAAEAFERLASTATGKGRLRAYRKAMDGIYFGNPPGKRDHVIELAKQAEPYYADDRLEAARIRLIKSPLEAEKRKELEAALLIFEEEFSLPDITRALAIKAFYEQLSSEKRALITSQLAVAMQKEFYGDSVSLALTIETSWQVFAAAGLLQEAWEKLTEAVKTGEKVGNYHHQGIAYVTMSRLLEVWGKTEEALAISLKAISTLEKTDGVRRQDRICADLARLYSKLGNLTCAEESMRQLTSQLPTIQLGDPQGLLNKRDKVRSQAIFFAAANRWDEAYQLLEEALEIARKAPMFPMFSQVVVRTDYAWVLNKQGRTEEAKAHLEEIQRLYDEVDRRFAHLDIYANLLAPRNVLVGQEFDMRFDVFNVSRITGSLVKIEALVPVKFTVINPKPEYAIENGSIDLREKKISAFEVETIKLRLKASEPDTYNLTPQVIYVDELGEVQTCKTNQVTITVKPAQPKFEIFPGRISTGFDDLDALLFGGIPEKYAVALVAPSLEEREQLVKRFLAAGVKSGETTFFVTVEPKNVKTLIEKYSSSFFLFVCNPQADAIVQDQTNIFKLKGLENLTDIDIALTKAFSKLNPTEKRAKRICIEVVSDILLQHHAINTRRWLSALLPKLKSKGFTVLAVVDTGMHPAEELQAVLGLFDGEISIQEKETPNGSAKFLRIKRLSNQKYSKEEIEL